METLDKFKLMGILLLFAVGLTACDKPGPAESAGRMIDQTVDQAGKKMDQAGKKIDEAVDTAGKKIGDAADKLSAQGAKAGVAMDDTEITAMVKAAIFAEPGLKTLQISVDTVGGVVTLSGAVDSSATSDKAKVLAGGVAGVNQVESRLVFKQPG
jgi:hyperosmotically inducible periplasmic protein